jgi:transcriptional regulator with XRE-family HTH domain
VSIDKKRQAMCSSVAQLLKEERERHGLSMTVLAARAGLSQQMVSYVERGMRNPTLDTLIRVTTAMEVDLADLIKRASSEDLLIKKKSR